MLRAQAQRRGLIHSLTLTRPGCPQYRGNDFPTAGHVAARLPSKKGPGAATTACTSARIDWVILGRPWLSLTHAAGKAFPPMCTPQAATTRSPWLARLVACSEPPPRPPGSSVAHSALLLKFVTFSVPHQARQTVQKRLSVARDVDTSIIQARDNDFRRCAATPSGPGTVEGKIEH